MNVSGMNRQWIRECFTPRPACSQEGPLRLYAGSDGGRPTFKVLGKERMVTKVLVNLILFRSIIGTKQFNDLLMRQRMGSWRVCVALS